MIITKETDYALRILRALQTGEKCRTSQICEEQQIPAAFAYKIIRKLAAAGLVENKRGPEGGIRALCDYSAVTLLDIVSIYEGNTHISPCTSPGYACPWALANGGCSVNGQLCRLEKEVAESMRQIRLDQLFQESQAS